MRTTGIIKNFILALIVIILLIPVFWLISVAFRYPDEVFQLLPTKIEWDNFYNSIKIINDHGQISFFRMYFNSILVTISSVSGVLVLSALAAFGFSNFKFKFKEPIFLLILLSIMIPVQVLLIPLFVLMKNIHLYNTYWVLILPYIAFNCPIGVFILRGFFEAIPNEIKEAGKVDGASDFIIFTKIILPISKPALATVLIMSFLGIWNEFIFALTFIKDDKLLTIPMALYRILNSDMYGVSYELYNAMALLTVLPILLVFIFMQRWFIEGLTAGSLKG